MAAGSLASRLTRRTALPARTQPAPMRIPAGGARRDFHRAGSDGPGNISHIWFTIATTRPTTSSASCCASIGTARPRLAWKPHWRFLRTRPGRLSQLAFRDAVGGQRKQPEQLFPHAVPAACSHHRHQRRPTANRQLYYNIDYRTTPIPCRPVAYFHAQYRQAQPNHGWTNNWNPMAILWWITSET